MKNEEKQHNQVYTGKRAQRAYECEQAPTTAHSAPTSVHDSPQPCTDPNALSQAITQRLSASEIVPRRPQSCIAASHGVATPIHNAMVHAAETT